MASTSYDSFQEETSIGFSTIEFYDPLSDDLIRILQLYVITPLHSAVSASGIVTNFFTIIILWKLGIKNSMNVGTLALSCTDFMATIIQFVQCLCYIMEYLDLNWKVDMWSLGAIWLAWLKYSAFCIAVGITTMISFERCLCVVLPFTVSKIFTKLRCLVYIIVLYVLYSIFLIFVYTTEETVWNLKIIVGKNNSFTEIRILTVVMTDRAEKVEFIIDAVVSISYSLLAQLALIVSTICMVRALIATSEVRQNTGEDHQRKNPEKILLAKSSMLSKRERKLVKVAISLAVVFTICNIPRYSVLAVHYTLPGMKEGVLKKLYGFLWDISDLFGTVNCSSNFFVYWLLNKRFRTHFRGLSCAYY